MKLVKMKATAVGTVVGDIVNLAGEVVTGVMVHVDPDNKLEDGRYNKPLVTEDVARKLEEAGFAERVGTVDFKPGQLLSGIEAEVESERVAETAEQEEDSPGSGPSGLDTRQVVNFQDGANVRGGADGTSEADDAADAPPATGGRRRRAPAAETGTGGEGGTGGTANTTGGGGAGAGSGSSEGGQQPA